jgi:hypothetical protein
VVKPRLMAAGADLNRVHRFQVEDDDGELLFTLPDDVHLVDSAIAGLREKGRTVAMVVIDPIGAFLPERTDSHKEAHVRRALAPLAAMAERCEVAIPIVMHLTKDESKRLISRVSGAGAFVNAARSVLGVVRHPDDPDGERGRERVLVHVASNWGRYAPSLGLKIESRDVTVDDGSVADVGLLVVTGEVDIGIEDVQRGADDDGESVVDAIVAELPEAPRSSLEVKEAVAKRVGCSLKTVERHAMRMREGGELKVVERGTRPEGGPPERTTTWALSSRDSQVGTPRHAVRVPTCDLPLDRGFAGDYASSGDTRRVIGPPGEEKAPGWAESLREKYGNDTGQQPEEDACASAD